MKGQLRALAVLLAGLIAINPLQVTAAEMSPYVQERQRLTSSRDRTDDGEAPLPETEEEYHPLIIAEEERRREENSKTFRLDDGTFWTAVYDSPVHYLDDDGEWQDIDNTLIPSNGFDAPEDEVMDSGYSMEEGTEEETENQVMDSGAPEILSVSESTEKRDEPAEEPRVMDSGPAANSLTEAVETKAGDVKIKLSKKAKEGKTVSVKSGGYTVKWGLAGVDKARMVDVEEKERKSSDPNDEFLFLDKLTNEVVYRDVFPDVDLQYYLTSDSVKENIILQSEEAVRSFTEIYDIGKLVPVQVDERTIHLYDPKDEDQETPVFSIHAPEMTDADGAFSDAVEIELVEQDKKRIAVEIRPDEDWLSDPERSYPVAIDPYVFTDQETAPIQDTFIAEDMPSSNFGSNGSMYIGNDSANYGVSRILVNFDLPPMGKGDMVVEATLHMVQMPAGISPSDGSITIDAYEAVNEWTETGATWNNSSNIQGDSPILDYYTARENTASQYSTWDVTDAVKKWYNGMGDSEADINQYGILLKAHDESEAVRAQYLASDNPNLGGMYPGLVISFINNVGLEDYWDYQVISAGLAGTSYVNLYTGNLVHQTPVMSTTGERAPASFVLTYNGYQSDLQYKNNQRGTITGTGWMNTFNQRFDQPAEANATTEAEKEKFERLAEAGYKFIYLDADGTEHYYKDSDTANEYEDEDGMGTTLKIDSSSTSERFVLEYEDGSKKTFTNGGYLYRIYDSEGNYIQTAYDGNNVSYFEDGAGRRSTLTVASTTVTQVLAPDGRDHGLRYDGSYLDHINFPGARTVTFVYDDEHRLQSVENPDGSMLVYEYFESAESPMVGNRVKSVTQIGTDGGSGGKVEFAYNSDNSTTVTYTRADEPEFEMIETWTFDRYGRTVSIINADGSAAAYEFTPESEAQESIRKSNKITQASSTIAPVNNLLLNHSAEQDGQNWSTSNWSTPGGSFSVDTTESWIGENSLHVTQEQTEPTRSAYYQDFEITGTFTASAYIKTEGVEDGYGAGVFLTWYNDNGEALFTQNSRGLFGDNDWKRVSVTADIPSGAAYVRVHFGLNYANGEAWFDAMQLEAGPTANAYNMLENSHFDYEGSGDLPLGWSGSNLDNSDKHNISADGNSFSIHGEPGVSKNLYQIVPVNRPADQVAFNISGKAMGTSVPVDNEKTYFCVDAVIYYDDGTNEPYLVQFSPDTSAKQYASGVVMPSQDAIDDGKTVASIRYYLLYYGNANDMAFSELQMNLDQSGAAYTYDDEGQIISAKDNANRNQIYDYTSANELANATDPNNESYDYTYDTTNPHRLIAARSEQTDIGFVYEYDDYGNVIGTKMGELNTSGELVSSSDYLESSVTMNTDGNYVTEVENQTGNTISYNIDSESGLTNSVTDPEGNTTEYTYDPDTYQLLTASGLSDAGTVEVEYSYDTSDRLESITRNGMTYSFEYDEFGNVISTQAGNTELAANTYGSGNGNLKEVLYGNDFTVNYQYDDYDRPTVIEENDAMKYRYTYDNRGNIAKIEDFIVGRDEPLTTVYNYDLLNRLLVEEKNDGTYLEYNYDIMDRITRVDYFFNNILQTFTYSYGDDNQLGETTLPGGLTVDHFYDSIGLPESNEVTTEDGAVLQTEFDYNFLSGSRVTSQLYDYTTTASVDGENTELAFFRYEYDDNGNIISVQDADGYVTEYTYDEMNQLIRADDENRGVTTVYTYDEGGNITSVEEYAYTTGTPGEVNTTYSYVYGDEDWTDLLTSYNGQGITYDEIGNPLTYRGMNFTWAGRRLTKTEIGSDTISYTYNIDGIRTSKTVGTETTEYFLEGNTIIAQKTGNNVLWFLYDADGQRIGFTYNDTPYLYVYNATGDVVGIVDDTLTMVVEYTYSPWGEILSTTGDEADTIGVINPFRYRGYYYDEETGLYYLNARYYDPETGRFISADAYISTGQGLTGNNMFVYGGNNPINHTDSSGMFWKEIGDWFRSIGNAVGNWLNSTFGAGSSTVSEFKIERAIIPDPSPIVIKTGTKTSTTVSEYGDSSKPISVYATRNLEHPIKSSSAGLNLNIYNFTLDVSIGLDNIGISGSLTSGDSTDSFGLGINLAELKVGFDTSTTVKWDANTSQSTFTSVDINGWAIVAGIVFATTGNPVPSPSY